MQLSHRVNALLQLKDLIRSFLNQKEKKEPIIGNEQIFENKLESAQAHNKWFTPVNIKASLRGVVSLIPNDLEIQLNSKYSFDKNEIKDIGVVSAGNIPLAGVHDFFCVLLAGHKYTGKLSSDDNILLPYLAELLIEINPKFKDLIHFEDGLLKNKDAYIASGSNNTSRYFEYYFGKYPNLIRKTRNAVAVLSGNETEEQLHQLGVDVFQYFGMGCRSISKLLLPIPYDFKILAEGFRNNVELLDHQKYHNNYIYQKTIFALAQKVFVDLDSCILIEQEAMAVPVGVLAYEFYKSEDDLKRILKRDEDITQCVISNIEAHISFGEAQNPNFFDYADGVDTLQFLVDL